MMKVALIKTLAMEFLKSKNILMAKTKTQKVHQVL